MIPNKWRDICKIKLTIACFDSSMEESVISMIRNDAPTCLTCDVRPGDVWNFHDFRRFMQDQPGNRSYAMTVQCFNGGNVTLQWPLRAIGLNYISVSNCLLVNYTEDYFDKDINQLPDTLAYYSITDCIMYIDVIHFLNVTRNVNHVTKAAKCGPEKYLNVAINRNISYQFKTIPDYFIEKLSDNLTIHAARNYHREVLVSPITCNYTKLLIIDQSKSKSLGSKHDSILLQNSKYPVLRILNLSDSMLNVLPERLDDWRLYFPRIKHLDLTYNSIKEFQTVLDYGIESEDPSIGLIDLRFNAITTVTRDELTRLQHHRYVKIDIRNNPFNCDCAMADFVEYFQVTTAEEKFGISGQYKYLLHLRCESPPSLKGRIIVDLTMDELACNKTELSDVRFYPVVLLAILTGILAIYLLLTIKQQVEMVVLLFKRLKRLCLCRPRHHHEQSSESNEIGLATS
ncbi:uncharacterized protein LOC132554965 [Ylistrum balloti]|uniref:uncharacterized protein LOC132554965 n=1 Tax=Ylistrum balloti TaxID=509963 RepID=UPI002905CAF3|nr:uncharacterized protein LOC132554965 [Ylistrum balloti]